jgi:hypothetical protein
MGELSKTKIDGEELLANDGYRSRNRLGLRPEELRRFVAATALTNFLTNMPSPLVFIVAGYIGLRALEIALRPQESFRTRMAQSLMTISAVGLLLMVVLFVLGEIVRATGVISPPWPASFSGKS